jgi:hypothetical protein
MGRVSRQRPPLARLALVSLLASVLAGCSTNGPYYRSARSPGQGVAYGSSAGGSPRHSSDDQTIAILLIVAIGIPIVIVRGIDKLAHWSW